MNGHHRRPRPALSAPARYGIRLTALVVLAVGVVGGLKVDAFSDRMSGALAADEITAAGQSDASVLKERTSDWLAATADDRAAQAAAADQAVAVARSWDERVRRAEQEASRRGAGRALNYGPIPSGCSDYSGNRAIGCAVLLEQGYGLDQMPCLDKLWTKESGWNHKARNVSSGAYGIPQALPGNKMAEFGDDWETNPATQVKWGLDYIKRRYGSPCGAWQHSIDTGWY